MLTNGEREIASGDGVSLSSVMQEADDLLEDPDD